ncbi:factor H binding protein domain-containing protein [Lonepinella sp. BR2919]|uniref:factor H binding protein domain-containing protein n=3 Tax=unclassified Lonepinella TaxID=2642006 RepID=UPI003F6DE75C
MKLNTITLAIVLSLGITACSSNSSPSHPTKNTDTVLTSAEAKAKAAAEEKAKLEAEAKAKAEEQAKLDAEAKAKAEAEEKARLEAEAKAKAEAEAKAKAEAEAKAKAEAEEKAKAEAEEKARLEAEAKAKAEAEEQARLEAEAKAKAEAEEQARLEAEEKARLEAEERAKTEPQDYAYVKESQQNSGIFSPLEGKDYFTGEDQIKSIVPADGSGRSERTSTTNSSSIVNGVSTVINATYTTYSNNLENSGIAVVNGRGTVNGRYANDYLYIYSGRATNPNELATLTGTATYNGSGYIGLDNATVNMNANFDKKTISGTIANEQRNIALQNADIKQDASFTGTATSDGLTGNYDGKFMGREAAEVAGKVMLSDEYGSKQGAVFSATKQ